MPRISKRAARHSGSWYSGHGTFRQTLSNRRENAPSILSQRVTLYLIWVFSDRIIYHVHVPAGTEYCALLRCCSTLCYSSVLPGDTLRDHIEAWMKKAGDTVADVEETKNGSYVKAIIAPHAGYAYSGSTMAYAYAHLDPNTIQRIFVLGPSHHFFSRKCHISECVEYETPLGNIEIDTDVYKQLKDTGAFSPLPVDDDEAEHSVEMHLPYIAHVMKGKRFTLVPIVVGALDPDSEAMYGKILEPYLGSRENAFIISSDFCHWGSRFGYQFRRKEDDEIHSSIAWLDSEGMKAIEKKNPEEFYRYLQAYENTICGRHPIGVLLQALYQHYEGRSDTYMIRFTRYDRSNLVCSMSDSSVSYASAIVAVSQDP